MIIIVAVLIVIIGICLAQDGGICGYLEPFFLSGSLSFLSPRETPTANLHFLARRASPLPIVHQALPTMSPQSFTFKKRNRSFAAS